MECIVFIGFINDYEEIELQEIKKNRNIIHYKPNKLIIRTYLFLIKLKLSVIINFLSFILCYKIKKYSYKANLIISDDHIVSLLLSKELNHRKKKLVLRNIVNNDKVLNLIIRSGFSDCYSFDINDCEKYGFKFYDQFCSGFNYLKKERGKGKLEYGCYFTGKDKGRKELVYDIVKKIKMDNSFIRIVEHKLDYIPYIEHLNYLEKSRVIIDIVQEGQVGPTMRMLEALMCHKKIITNNKLIERMSFYSGDNILIYDRENTTEKDISKFLEKKQKIVNEDFLIRLNPTRFYESIINE